MIKSTTVKLKKSDTVLDNIKIEKTLSDMGYTPVRWAIVGVEDDNFIISVAYSTC